MSDRGQTNPPTPPTPESLTASGLHFNTAAVAVASCAAPASLLTGDQQMLIRKINSGREGGRDGGEWGHDVFEAA